jgi:hypothetical protein
MIRRHLNDESCLICEIQSKVYVKRSYKTILVEVIGSLNSQG